MQQRHTRPHRKLGAHQTEAKAFLPAGHHFATVAGPELEAPTLTRLDDRPFSRRLHLHRSMDEGFEVLRGRIGFRIGAVYEVIEAGDGVLIPAGVPQRFRALEPAEVVLITSGPRGPDAIAELAGGNLMDMDWTASVLERYNTELLERQPHWAPSLG